MSTTGPLAVLWGIIEPLLTPALVAAVALTLAATHIAKVIAEYLLPAVTRSPAAWRAFKAGASVIAGLLIGTATWLVTGSGIGVVPAAALASGPIWLGLTALLPSRVRDAFMTPTDRRHKGNGQAGNN